MSADVERALLVAIKRAREAHASCSRFYRADGDYRRCRCGVEVMTNAEWNEHRDRAVLDALGLEQVCEIASDPNYSENYLGLVVRDWFFSLTGGSGEATDGR